MITCARYFATPWRGCPRGALAAMVLGLLWLVAIPRDAAAPGDLDPSFGGVGFVTTPIGDAAEADALIVQSDGKLVAGGFSPGVQSTALTLARYNTDGALDTSFGGGTGIVTVGDNSEVGALAQQPDGKLVAAGWNDAVNSFVLARFNTDGTLDTSFGSGTGIVMTPMPDHAEATALVLQPDGKLVAAGAGD